MRPARPTAPAHEDQAGEKTRSTHAHLGVVTGADSQIEQNRIEAYSSNIEGNLPHHSNNIEQRKGKFYKKIKRK